MPNCLAARGPRRTTMSSGAYSLRLSDVRLAYDPGAEPAAWLRARDRPGGPEPQGLHLPRSKWLGPLLLLRSIIC